MYGCTMRRRRYDVEESSVYGYTMSKQSGHCVRPRQLVSSSWDRSSESPSSHQGLTLDHPDCLLIVCR